MKPEKTERTEKPLGVETRARRDPDAIRRAFETGDYPYSTKVKEKAYLERMLPLQAELLKAQNWIKETGEKIVMLFEGRDAAGKGGTIKRFMEHLNTAQMRRSAFSIPANALAEMAMRWKPAGSSSASSPWLIQTARVAGRPANNVEAPSSIVTSAWPYSRLTPERTLPPR